MNTEIATIDLQSHRAFGVRVTESVSDSQVKDLIGHKETFHIVEYNSLLQNDHHAQQDTEGRRPSFLKLARKIAAELDKTVKITPLKKFLQFLLLLIVFFVIVILALTTISAVTEISFIKTMEDWVFYTVVIVTGMATVAGFWIFDLPSKIEVIKKQFNPSRLKAFEKANKDGQKEIAAYTELMKKWIPGKEKVLLLLYYIYWEIDEEDADNHINRFIAELLKFKNVYLVYCIDENDLMFGQHSRLDTLKTELNKRNIEVAQVSLPDVYIDRLKTKTESYGDVLFYEQLMKTVRTIRPNDFEIDIITKHLDAIIEEFRNNGNLQLGSYINRGNPSGSAREKKNQIIASRFFAKENCFGLNLEEDLEVLLITLLYHHYFFNNKPLSEAVLEKFFALKYAATIRNQLGLSLPVFLDYIVNGNNAAISENIHKTYLNKVYEKVARLRAVRFIESSRSFSIKKELWLVHYIITNRDSLYKELEKPNYLKTRYLIDFDEYVKFFLFTGIHLHSYTEKEIERMLSYLDESERPLYQLLLAHELSNTPFDREKASEKYIYGATLALKFWKDPPAYAEEPFFSMFGYDIGIAELGINPYNLLCQVLSDAMHKFNYVDCSFEDLGAITSGLPGDIFHAFPGTYEECMAKHRALEMKYRFYRSEFNYERCDEYPDINLMIDIDDHLVILLPSVESPHGDEVPLIDTAKYVDVQTDDPDFIFLQILSIVHNNYLYVDGWFAERQTVNQEELDIARKKVDAFEDILFQLQKTELNYKDYYRYRLWEVKYYLVFNLFKKCKIKNQFRFYKSKESYDFNKFKSVTEGFEALGNYFGVMDALFWECWFETRLPLELAQGYLQQKMDGSALDKVKVEQNIRRIIDYKNNYVQYVHFDCGLIYMAIITNSIIEPPQAYSLIKKFLADKQSIPRFIKHKLVSHLRIICYNGGFTRKEVLDEECLQLSRQLLTEYAEYSSDSDKLHLRIMTIPKLLPHQDEFEAELKETFDLVRNNLERVDAFNKALFYYHYTRYLYSKKNYDELADSNYVAEALTLLKPYKFYYLQFLGFYLLLYYPIIRSRKAQALAEKESTLIKEYNSIVEEYNAIKTEPHSNVIDINTGSAQKDKLNILKKELEEINRQRAAYQDNDMVKELEHEFESFVRTYNSSVRITGEIHPDRYVIARTARTIGELYHNKYNIRDDRTIRYYEISLENFYQLNEFILFLEVALELKSFYRNRKLVEKINRVETQVRSILNDTFIRPGRTYILDPGSSADKKTEQFAHLIYDYFNANLDNTREDYSLEVGYEDKIEKVQQGFRLDNDTRGLRKLLILFFTNVHNMESTERVIKSFEEIAEYAMGHIDSVSLNDVQSIEAGFKQIVSKTKDKMEWQDRKIALEEIVAEVRKKYQSKVAAYIQSSVKAPAMASLP